MHPSALAILMLQIAAILGLSRLMGLLFQRFRQPQVIGEMAAGIMLGPTILGWLAPDVFAGLFPAERIAYLGNLSQLGVIFFLFLVGLELDPRHLLSRGHSAAAVALTSFLVPCAMGVGLTFWLSRQNTSFAHNTHDFITGALFIGTAIAVTALPVLARVVNEAGLQKSSMGTVSIAAAAAKDGIAWCMLAAIIAYAQAGGLWQGMTTALLTLCYVGLMFLLVRPFLKRLEAAFTRETRLSPGVIALIFLLILLSAIATELIGIHALFGAFVLGAIMPKGSQFVGSVAEKIEDFTVVLLLPIFFAYAGLNTHIELTGGQEFWSWTLMIIAVACLGMIGSATAAARVSGMGLRDSIGVGVLMNTRGLMELIILNVGREMGIIGNRLYAMMVLMALATTAMTAPLVHLLQWPARAKRQAERQTGYSILLPVAMPRSAVPLADLADLISGRGKPNRQAIGLYIRAVRDFDLLRSQMAEPIDHEEPEPLVRLKEEAIKRKLSVTTLCTSATDPGAEIARVANSRGCNLVLMGFHKPLLTQSILGGTVHKVMVQANCHVGVFVDRGFHGARKILVPFLGSSHDRLALELAGRIGQSASAEVTVLHVVEPGRSSQYKLGAEESVHRVYRDPTQPQPVTFRVVEDASPVDAVLRETAGYDLLVLGVAEEWGLESAMFGFRRERLVTECPAPILIVKRGST
jgi:Kef-type K+ transport system membrane component KefB